MLPVAGDRIGTRVCDEGQAGLGAGAAGVADERDHVVVVHQLARVGQHGVALAAVVGGHQPQQAAGNAAIGIGTGQRGFDAGLDVARVVGLATGEAATLADEDGAGVLC